MLQGKQSKASDTDNEDVEENEFQGSNQIQWLNAFANRILFDMYRSPYWLSKIHEKLYKKLNSIRVSLEIIIYLF